MRIFFIKKNSLTLSQQVSPRRHCAGSLPPSQNEQVFLSKKDSLTLSQLVSPRRHCAGSLQAFYDKRLKEGNIKTQNSKHHYNNIYRNRGNQLWHYFFGQVQLRRRPPVLVETVYKQTWGETTDLSLKFSHVELFHGEFQAPGEVMVDAYRH